MRHGLKMGYYFSDWSVVNYMLRNPLGIRRTVRKQSIRRKLKHISTGVDEHGKQKEDPKSGVPL
jgi:hypothetical protein